MSENEETLDERLAVERLNEALALQLGSALQYSLTAASIRSRPDATCTRYRAHARFAT